MIARGDRIDVDALAREIRRVDGDNSLGAGALAEKIVAYLAAASNADAALVACDFCDGRGWVAGLGAETACPRCSIPAAPATPPAAGSVTDEMVERAARLQRLLDARDGTSNTHVWADLELDIIEAAKALLAALAAAPVPPVVGEDAEVETERKLATVVAPDNGTTDEVLRAVLECATAWAPEARIIGNVRAGDIARAVLSTLSHSAPERTLPATGAFVDRLIRIFNNRPDDDASAIVLTDYARAALASSVPVGVRGLVEFAKEMCRIGFDGGSVDGCDILDDAVKHGLCKVVQYHAGMTGIANPEYYEEGDAVYVFTEALSPAQGWREPEGWRAPAQEAAAYRVLGEPDLPIHLVRTKADAEHMVRNLIAYRRGCTKAWFEPLYAFSTPQAPAGEWRCVPVEPTEAMILAADSAHEQASDASLIAGGSGRGLDADGIYRAMLAAAPLPSALAGGKDAD